MLRDPAKAGKFTVKGGKMEIIIGLIEIIIGLIILFLLIALYLLPAIIAQFKERKNATAIFLLNLLLGWTFFGWVIALVWAFIEDK